MISITEEVEVTKPLVASWVALLYAIGFLCVVYSLGQNVLPTCFYGGLGVGLSGTLLGVFFEDSFGVSVKAARLTLQNIAFVSIVFGIVFGLIMYIAPAIFQ